jgi:AraC-like DNA-binding protein
MNRIFSSLTEKDIALPVYVTGVGFEEYQDHVIRKGGFPNYHLAICENGVGRLLLDGKEYLIEKGMAFFFCPDIPHEYYPLSEPWSIKWIIFMGSGVGALLNAINFKNYEVFRINNMEEFHLYYNKLFRTLSVKSANNILEASGILYSFLTNINSLCEAINMENRSQLTNKLNNIIEYIKTNFQEDISLEQLAAMAEISPSYLCRIFRKTYNMSPFTYILRCRISAAKEWLINYPDKSIKHIAYEAGFHNVSYFGLVFREQEGCSPNQFRRYWVKE